MFPKQLLLLELMLVLELDVHVQLLQDHYIEQDSHCCIQEYNNDYPVLYNDPEVTEHVHQALEQASIPEVEAVLETSPQPPSEDFAYFLEKVPGCFFYVGAIPK